MAERDYPVGHPAASDYKGERYTPPRAPFGEDFGPDHPARGGKNTSTADTPDGMRERTVKDWQANADRMAVAEPPATPPTGDDTGDGKQGTVTTITITGEVVNTAPER